MSEKAMDMQSPSSNMKVFDPVAQQPASTFTSYPLQQVLEQQDKSYAQPIPAIPAAPTNNAAVANQYQAELYARCARGDHQISRKYGICGIITALACFPFGLICLFTDSQLICMRCGLRIEKQKTTAQA